MIHIFTKYLDKSYRILIADIAKQDVELARAVVEAPWSAAQVTSELRLTLAVISDISGDDAALAREREALRSVLTPAEYVDVAGVIGAFNVVDRIADSTGIPLDGFLVGMSGDVRSELDLARFASSANTPGA